MIVARDQVKIAAAAATAAGAAEGMWLQGQRKACGFRVPPDVTNFMRSSFLPTCELAALKSLEGQSTRVKYAP